MKYRVIKEYAGIEVGSEIKIKEGAVRYMVESGYVEPINEQTNPNTQSDSPAQNKAIEPKYKRNKIK